MTRLQFIAYYQSSMAASINIKKVYFRIKFEARHDQCHSAFMIDAVKEELLDKKRYTYTRTRT